MTLGLIGDETALFNIEKSGVIGFTPPLSETKHVLTCSCQSLTFISMSLTSTGMPSESRHLKRKFDYFKSLYLFIKMICKHRIVINNNKY